MGRMNKNITFKDKLSIYINTAGKIIRGLLNRWRFKKVSGLIFIARGVTLLNVGNIVLGKNVKFENNSEVQGLASQVMMFGDNVTIGRNTMIRPSSYYGVGEIGEGCHIGYNSSIGPFGYVGCAGKVIIGNNVMIGPRVSIFAENHNFSDKNKSIKSQGVNNKGIVIEDDCWIGSGAVILDGVTIGKGSIIGAGTVVTKNIPENSKVFDKRTKLVQRR